MKATIYLFRHAEGQHNYAISTRDFKTSMSEVLSSQLFFDSSLSEKGIQQCKNIQLPTELQFLKNPSSSIPSNYSILCSPLRRCIQTLHNSFPCVKALTILDALREQCGLYPCDQRRPFTEIEKYALELFPHCEFVYEENEDKLWNPNHRESSASVFSRCHTFLNFITETCESLPPGTNDYSFICLGHCSFYRHVLSMLQLFDPKDRAATNTGHYKFTVDIKKFNTFLESFSVAEFFRLESDSSPLQCNVPDVFKRFSCDELLFYTLPTLDSLKSCSISAPCSILTFPPIIELSQIPNEIKQRHSENLHTAVQNVSIFKEAINKFIESHQKYVSIDNVLLTEAIEELRPIELITDASQILKPTSFMKPSKIFWDLLMKERLIGQRCIIFVLPPKLCAYILIIWKEIIGMNTHDLWKSYQSADFVSTFNFEYLKTLCTSVMPKFGGTKQAIPIQILDLNVD